MLRAFVLALVLANLGYFAWTHGMFAALGFVPARLTETEPQRLANQLRPGLLQIRPEAAAVLPPSIAASSPASAASVPTVQ